MEINSRTSLSIGPVPSNSGTSERSTRVMKEQDRVSRMRIAWVQNRMTGFRISGVRRMNDRMVSGTACRGFSERVSSTASGPGGSVYIQLSKTIHLVGKLIDLLGF